MPLATATPEGFAESQTALDHPVKLRSADTMGVNRIGMIHWMTAVSLIHDPAPAPFDESSYGRRLQVLYDEYPGMSTSRARQIARTWRSYIAWSLSRAILLSAATTPEPANLRHW